MSAASKETMIELVREWAAKKPEISRVWLFGSRIRGKSYSGGPIRPDSDWDVAVEFGSPTPEARDAHWFRVVNAWDKDLDAAAGCSVSIEHYNPPNTPRVAGGVEECGLLVYDRKADGKR